MLADVITEPLGQLLTADRIPAYVVADEFAIMAYCVGVAIPLFPRPGDHLLRTANVADPDSSGAADGSAIACGLRPTTTPGPASLDRWMRC